MYVCICNVVTEDDVYRCMADGCRTAKEVKAACGFKPNCGMCTKRIHTMVSRYRTAGELADAVTGGPAALTPVPEASEPPSEAVSEAATEVAFEVAPEAPSAPVRPGTPMHDPESAEGGIAPQTAA
ncbi:MAG TPA: (2Fe-2S)-binding protein [Spirillospora sp.]